MKVYLDHAATTPVAREVLEAMEPFFLESFGNPSSLHAKGREALEALEQARKRIASTLNTTPDTIIFTSGGTESNNLAIAGLSGIPGKNHLITSSVEHASVMETCKNLERKGVKVTYLPVDGEGFIGQGKLEKAITSSTFLVSIMHGNNEIGTVQDIREIGRICGEKGILFHTDAVQTYIKIPIDVKKAGISLLSASAHKINGPKGVGFLYRRRGTQLKPQIFGGGHEFGLRSGTENVPGIVGLAAATSLKTDYSKISLLRDKIIRETLSIPGTRLNGPRDPNLRLPNNAHFSFKGLEGDGLVLKLSEAGIAVSTGSACSSKLRKPSHVLKAIGLSDQEALGSLRVSLGRETTEKDVDYLLEKLAEVLHS